MKETRLKVQQSVGLQSAQNMVTLSFARWEFLSCSGTTRGPQSSVRMTPRLMKHSLPLQLGPVPALLRCAVTFLVLSLLSAPASAFLIPGLGPNVLHEGDPIELHVNKFSSDVTQLPFAYYDNKFVCPPKDGVKQTLLNLGEVFRGDRNMNSDFKIRTKEKIPCEILCEVQIDAETASSLSNMIKDEYRVEWLLDDLPAATPYTTSENKKKQYEAGFRLGSVDPTNGKTLLHNHVTMNILYNTKAEDPAANLIVGFEVYPKSVSITDGKCPDAMLDQQQLPMEIGNEATKITWTYSVFWREEDKVNWANRWDLYLVNSDPQIHWYSIINSLIIMLFLTAMVAIIMLRTLNKDIALYNEEDLKLKEEQENTTGWKLVHGDVFRPPKLGGLLAPFLGSGIQLLLMTGLTLTFAVLGVLNPSYRGGILSFALFLFTFMGTFAGYYSSRMYKVFKGTSWKKNAVVTALLCPGVILVLVFGLNLFVWSQHASSAIPFGTFFALGMMWIGISLPLVMLGAYFGFKKKVIEHPVRTNQIPRQIPEQIWYLNPGVSILAGGLMPFAVCFIELFFIMKSIWQDQYYYMFGFVGLVGTVLVVTCIEITIVITYFQLCGEDYHWWWRSFFISSSSAFYIFLYALYYVSHLRIHDFVPMLVYLVDSLIACLIYGLCAGTIGFFSTYMFLIHVYSRIKLD